MVEPVATGMFLAVQEQMLQDVCASTSLRYDQHRSTVQQVGSVWTRIPVNKVNRQTLAVTAVATLLGCNTRTHRSLERFRGQVIHEASSVQCASSPDCCAS